MLVIYHGGCTDGWYAALTAKKAYPDAELFGAVHGYPPPDVTGKDVLLVDFSYKRAVLEEMARVAKSIRVLDHHKTAQEDLAGLAFCTFDMNRSGAGMAWDELIKTPRPWYIDYVEDRDLWRFDLDHSKEVNAYIMSLPQGDLSLFDTLSAVSRDNAVMFGEVALRVRQDAVRYAANQAYVGAIDGQECLCVNANGWVSSELGNVLSERHANRWAFCWAYMADGTISYSLRSAVDGPDVSELAKKYGGGGHPHAAGFRTKEPVHVRVR